MTRISSSGIRRGSAPGAFLSISPAAAEQLEPRLLFSVFTVTNTNDSGDGSLRAAILAANAQQTTADTIVFSIPGAAVHTLAPHSALPPIRGPVTIDGTSQSGFSGTPVIELDGTNAGAANGLTLAANATVAGLVVNRFKQDGILISAGVVHLEGNYIGTDVTGNAASPNRGSGIDVAPGSATVSATVGFDPSASTPTAAAVAAARNVISGNGSSGIVAGSFVQVFGNFIGTNAAGTAALGNASAGIALGLLTRALIGQGMPGGSGTLGNVISGNGQSGIDCGVGAEIYGNLIGTDVSGTHALGNGTSPQAATRDGITSFGGAVIGSSNGRNIISGNFGNGISGRATIRNNYIGTDLTGNAAIGNAADGVLLGTDSTVGGVDAGSGNVISGNGRNGIEIQAGTGGYVWGNTIGLNAAGTAVLGNRVNGIEVAAGSVQIGDPGPNQANVISGNGGHGVAIDGSGSQFGGRLLNNRIGTDAAGDTIPGFGNAYDGVYIASGVLGAEIGQSVDGQPSANRSNTIAFNGRNGITVAGAVFPPESSTVTISGNSIYGNARLGIDLANDGVTPNDHLDSDRGPNGLQNYPVIRSAELAPRGISVRFTLDTRPNSMNLVEFFASDMADPSGYGEGKTFLKGISLTADGTGQISGTVLLPDAPIGSLITATADSGEGTSEFSAAMPVMRPVVVGRHVFYNNSEFDGHTTSARLGDIAAIATDKQALLPGQTATFANYTSYDKGINGVMIDVQGGHNLTNDDFIFKVGNDNNPADWVDAPQPAEPIVLRSGGNSANNPSAPQVDRIVFVWLDGVIRNEWLQVTMKADNNTALASSDVFYFGNAAGESGDNPANALVNATDEIGARNDQHNFLNPASITNVHDYNRDTKVDATDELIARNNNTDFITALKLIAPPAAAATFPLATVTLSATTSPPSAGAPAKPLHPSSEDWLDSLLI